MSQLLIKYLLFCLLLSTQDGITALMLASQYGAMAVVQALIAAKADLNLQDKVCFLCSFLYRFCCFMYAQNEGLLTVDH